ncbi:hypothetical protein HK098_000937 [Nowakowskiella sp. JEL0407]|nr:hypothetical protein HK098_000937 [Nowakowskiella sp. JEL0407]
MSSSQRTNERTRGRPRGTKNASSHKAGRPTVGDVARSKRLKLIESGEAETRSLAARQLLNSFSKFHPVSNLLQPKLRFHPNTSSLTSFNTTKETDSASEASESEFDSEHSTTNSRPDGLNDHSTSVSMEETSRRDILEDITHRFENFEDSDEDGDSEDDEMDVGELDNDEECEQESVKIDGFITQYIMHILNKLRAECGNDGKGIPNCYRNGSHWIHPPSPISILQDPKNAANLPNALYCPPVYVWLPDRLILGGLRCPDCKTALSKNGWCDKPIARRVVDLDCCFYIISQKYHCKKCNSKFRGTSKRIIESLPLYAQIEFPAYLSYRSGLSKRVMELMRSCFFGSIGPDPFAALLREHHFLRHSKLEAQFLSHIYHQQTLPERLFNLPENYPSFSKFNNKHLYSGFTPSAPYLQKMYMEFMEKL